MLSLQPQTILSRSFKISPNVAAFTMQIYKIFRYLQFFINFD